jgi:hypothetical protein
MKKFNENKILDLDKEEFVELESKSNLQKKKIEEEIKDLLKEKTH